jgi:hypothetical protein
VSVDPRKARDLALLDALDAFTREAVELTVWRVVREGRDPIQAASSRSRWCNDSFDVLYTSLERDGALAEIFALLNSQPVFPSKVQFFVHRISIRASKILRIADLRTLERLGVNGPRYRERDYQRTQEIADAAYFLGFEGLIATSARWEGLSLVLFTDHLAPEDILLDQREPDPVDWALWRRKHSGRTGR